MLKHEYPTNQFLSTGIKVIDIRTRGEWQQTGILKNSIPITFFDEFGRYDTKKFISEVESHISKDEKFAIICRTGHRTIDVGEFLASKGFNVINLIGGIYKVMDMNSFEIVEFKNF